MVAPGGPISNAQGNLGGVNITGRKRKTGQEGKPIGNVNNNGIGAVKVDGGRPEILGGRRMMPRWA